MFGWGENISGQLGDGTQVGREEPTRVEALTGQGLRSLHCGKANSAAVTREGRVFLWGRGRDGLLGGDGGARAKTSTQPQQLSFAEDVAHFSLGDSHAAIVTAKGDLYSHKLHLGTGSALKARSEARGRAAGPPPLRRAVEPR